MKVQIKQKGKKKSFNVIDKWSDVTLEKWAKLIAIKGFSKIKEAKETILALSDIPEKVLNKLEVYHIAAILQGLSSMQKEETTCLRETIEIEGVEYGFHPDLEQMTLGEFVDLETYIEDIKNNMPEIMAILFRPVTDKSVNYYNIEAYDGKIKKRAEIMKNIPAEKVQDALVFFYNFGSILLTILLSSLTQDTAATKKQ
tara:strand:+ start:262 stop:858 length:597 start_codon:yes stop_codon:yes gene_type:complete